MMEVDYIKEVKRQFNLEPVTYFIFRRGTRFSLEELQIYLYQIDGLENEMLKNNHKYKQDKKYKRPMITIILFVDQNRKCKIKALSVRSQKDEFDEERGMNEAARHALRLLKGRGETPVRRSYAIRALINCCVNTTVHAEEYPNLDLYEKSLLSSKNKVVNSILNENVNFYSGVDFANTRADFTTISMPSVKFLLEQKLGEMSNEIKKEK